MAINFPTSPVNGDIHTAQGIQWQWDATGGTWKCQGVTGVYTLGIASASSLGGIKIGNNLNISASTGVLDAVMNLNNESISELTDVTFNNVTLDANNGNGKVLAWSQTLQAFAPVDQTGGGGGGGSSTFVGLTDTPGSMGTAGQFLTVNSGGNALEFTAAPAGTLSGLTDTDLTTSAPTGGEVLFYDATSTDWVPLQFSFDNLMGVDVTTTPPTDGQSLVYDSSISLWKPATVSGGGGGSGLTSRTTGTATASALADGGSQDLTITAAKTYALLKIQTSHAAWVTVYTSNAARVADQNRLEVTDPQPGSGVIAEVITSDGALVPITPGTIGWNNDSTPSTTAYIKVVNKSGQTRDIDVTLHFVQLEV